MVKILLVDDDEAVRRALTRYLVSRGHAVREAVDGADALRQLEQALPELLLTDLVMPDHEGIELIIKAHRRWPALAVIAMSGGGSVNAPDRYLAIAEALGAEQLLAKPFSLARLDQAIDRLCPPSGDAPPTAQEAPRPGEWGSHRA